MQQSYPGQSIGGSVLLGASHFGAYHPSFGQCRELIRWPSPKGCYWVFLWDWHRNFWLRLSTAPQVTSLALPPLNHFSRNLSVLGRSWSSEVNNPSPGALKDKSPPCERKYKDGFASKLFEIDPLSWKSRTISHVCTLGYAPCIKCSGKCQCAHTSGPTRS